MNDIVSVPHNALFNLCARIHILIDYKKKLLGEAAKDEENCTSFNTWSRAFHLRNDVEDLQLLRDLALDCATEDIKDFYTHYDEIMAKCPF